MLLLLRGGVCVTVGPTLRSKYEYFVCNDRPPNQPKFRRAFREIRDRPNFETQCAKLWTTPKCSKKRKPPNECANAIALFVSNKLPSLGGGNEQRNGNEVLRTLAAVAC